jgi:hypothetical protein
MPLEYAAAAAIVAQLFDPDDIPGSITRSIAAFQDNPELHEAYKEGKVGNPITVRSGVDGQRMAAKMMRNSANAAQDWVEGIQNPRANPQTAAVAAAGKWQTGVQAAIAGGRYAAGVRAYDIDDAISTAVSDGGAAYVAGIAKRGRKIERAMDIVARDLTAVSAAVRQMPQDTLPQRIARSAAQINGMVAAKDRRTGGSAAAR